MAVGDKWIVIDSVVNGLMVRSGPSTNDSLVSGLKAGDIVTEEEEQDGWIKHDKGGWSYAGYMKIYEEAGEDKESTDDEENDIEYEEEEEELETEDYRPNMDSLFKNNNFISDSDFTDMRNINGVLGLPYQFLPFTDPRLHDGSDYNGQDSSLSRNNIGYEYAQKIIARMPLLMISPGKASFMTQFSDEERESALGQVIGTGNNDEESGTSELFQSPGRYYTFAYDETEYYSVVNPMCRIAARYLGIEDIKIDGKTRLENMHWLEYTKGKIKGLSDFGDFLAIPFYVNAETSISESFTNSTTQSMIASTVNSISDMSRELRFLLGTDAGLDAIEGDSEVMSAVENVQEIIGKLMGGKNFLNALVGHLTTVAAGGKMVFPEIWSDSKFSRSYTCEIKLVSPDPSPLSVYMNVLVPLFHLIALVGPRAVPGNPNGYTNPFLVRCCYKGFFNIDTGIITDMSVTKGAECQWTPEGIPTSVNVSMGIKDLYDAMALSATEADDWSFSTVENTAEMDYIANLCGINIFKPEIMRMMELMIVNGVENRAKDFFKVNLWTGIQQKAQNIIMKNIYGR